MSGWDTSGSFTQWPVPKPPCGKISSLFWNIPRRSLMVTDDLGEPIGLILKVMQFMTLDPSVIGVSEGNIVFPVKSELESIFVMPST